jgi:hypothetical protein
MMGEEGNQRFEVRRPPACGKVSGNNSLAWRLAPGVAAGRLQGAQRHLEKAYTWGLGVSWQPARNLKQRSPIGLASLWQKVSDILPAAGPLPTLPSIRVHNAGAHMGISAVPQQRF